MDTITVITQQMYNDLLTERNEIVQDLRAAKDILVKIAISIGAMDSEGNVNEKYDLKQVAKLMGKVLTNPTALKAEFDFVKNLSPILEKYKNL